MIQKGKIIAIDLMSTKVRIEVLGAQGSITPFIEVPTRLMPDLMLESRVAFTLFNDCTGIVLEHIVGD